MPNRETLNGAEQAALDAWERGSADTVGMLYSVRAAITHIERTEDARLAIAEQKVAELTETLTKVRDIAYRADTSSLVAAGQALEAIHQRATKAVTGG